MTERMPANPRPMRIRLAINGRFLTQGVTGVQRVCREFTSALDGLLARGELPGVSARVLVPKSPNFETPRYAALPVEPVGRLKGYAWEQAELSKAAGGDVLLCLANLAPLSRLARRDPTVVVVHDLSYKYFPSAYSQAFRAAYSIAMPVVMRQADCVITVSESERRAILAAFPNIPGLPERLIAAANGGWSKEFLERHSGAVTPREDFALYIGTFSKRKNIDGVLQTAIRLARNHGVRFVFAGGTNSAFAGTDMEIPSDVATKFEFLGQVNDPDRLADLYKRAAVLVFPSHYESSGLPPIEAMALGCPVVVSRDPALVERCGEAAVYCDARDVTSIVEAVLSVVSSPERARQLGDAGIERAKLFSWESQVRDVLGAVDNSQRARLSK